MDIKQIAQNKFANYKNVAFIVIAILILIVRKSDSLFNPQLWAEDGTVFFAQQYEYGAASIFTAYANYLHLVPRLIAVFADSFFSYAYVPAVYNYSALLVTIIVITHCFSPRLQLPFKPLLALSIVLVPSYLNEVFLNTANIQWILDILLVLLLLKDSPDRKYGNYTLQVLADFSTVILVGLSSPFFLIIAPFLGWKLFKTKNTYGFTLLVLMISIAIIQIIQISIAPVDTVYPHGSIWDLNLYLSMIGKKMFGGLLFGRALRNANIAMVGLGTLLFCGTLLYLAHNNGKLKIACMFLTISVLLILSVIIRYEFSFAVMTMTTGCRYFYVPYVLITWLLILCLSQRGVWKNVFVTSALLLVLFSAFSLGFQTHFTDYNWQYYSKLIGTKDTINIPINPHWSITLHSKNK